MDEVVIVVVSDVSDVRDVGDEVGVHWSIREEAGVVGLTRYSGVEADFLSAVGGLYWWTSGSATGGSGAAAIAASAAAKAVGDTGDTRCGGYPTPGAPCCSSGIAAHWASHPAMVVGCGTASAASAPDASNGGCKTGAWLADESTS